MGPMGKRRGLLWIGCAVLAVGGAWTGVRIVDPTVAPARIPTDGSKGPPDPVADDPPPATLGAAGTGTSAPATAPSSTAAAPSVDRFRATGVVRSGDDGPGLGHATVEVFGGWNAWDPLLGRGETDDSGRFAIDLPALDRMSPEARSELTVSACARAKGHRAGKPRAFAGRDQAGPPCDLRGDLVLVPGHDVFGRVVDAAGQGVAGVKVILEDGSRFPQQPKVRTDAEGRYRFGIEKEGEFALLAEQEGFGTASAPGMWVSREADTECPDMVIRRAAEIAGTVADARGRPLEGVPVYAWVQGTPPRSELRAWVGAPPGRQRGWASTDGAGRFRITGLFPGPAQVLAIAGYEEGPRMASTATGTENVRLVVREHVLRVDVVDTLGAPLEGASWSVTEVAASPAPAQTGVVYRDGARAGYALVPEGARVRIAASHPGCAASRVETTCEGAGPSQVTIRLAKAGAPGRLRLVPTGPGSERARYVRVEVSAPDTGTIEEGSRDLPLDETLELKAGRHQLQLLPVDGDRGSEVSGFSPASVEVDVPSGGDITLPVQATLGGRLQVTFVWPPGTVEALLMGARFRSLDGSATPREVMWIHKSAGGFEYHGPAFPLSPHHPMTTAVGLTPGRWIVELEVSGFATASVSATLTAGETTSVSAVLERDTK